MVSATEISNEEIEMYQEIYKRKQTPKEEYLNGGDVLKRLNLSLDEKNVSEIDKR